MFTMDSTMVAAYLRVSLRWCLKVTVVVVSLATVALWCVNTALRGVVGNQGIVAILPLAVFFGTGILTKDDFNSFLWNIVMLAQVCICSVSCASKNWT